jgi:hypothetical protein
MLRGSFAVLFLAAAVPAAAQDSGGVQLRDPAATLGQIDANRGCPMSATSVTVGVNKATGNGSAAQQKLTTAGGGGPAGCHPLVSTQVVTGVNLGLGRGSSAGQTIDATGPKGALATTTFTRGNNVGFGASSTANQRISNQTGR